MTKPSLRTKTFNELVELASIGGAFMALAEKYAAVMEAPIKRRKRRRKAVEPPLVKAKVVAEAGDGVDKMVDVATTKAVKAKSRRSKAPAVPKPRGRKIPRKDIPALQEEQ